MADSSKDGRRNLPSWMSNRDNESKPRGKKPVEVDQQKGDSRDEDPEVAKRPGKAHIVSSPSKTNEKNGKLSLGCTGFSKLLDGVVFVLSGFVNPERGLLRSQALEMGAEYQADWNSNCTLLICAFPNTPKFRQVEADGGTIVSKEWISECYVHKKLVDIETYLMHVGKLWRRQNISHESSKDQESSVSKKSQKLGERGSHPKPISASSKDIGASDHVEAHFFPSKVKNWVVDDLNKTISWLETQDEKPEPSEVKKIAAQGILTCIQDVIDILEQEQEIQQITEQWNFIPRLVEELAKVESSRKTTPKRVLHKHAVACKRIYEAELGKLDNDWSAKKKKRLNTDEVPKEAYDSDETVEMTEEEIDLAYNTVAASKLCK